MTNWWKNKQISEKKCELVKRSYKKGQASEIKSQTSEKKSDKKWQTSEKSVKKWKTSKIKTNKWKFKWQNVTD